MQSIADEYLSKIKVKVTRKENDGRKNLCGEPFNEEEQCWYIPAHQAEYAKNAYAKYTVHPEAISTTLKQEKTPKETAEDMPGIARATPHETVKKKG